MARIKSGPVRTYPPPEDVAGITQIQSVDRTSESFSSSSSASTCPQCKSIFQDMSIAVGYLPDIVDISVASLLTELQDFKDHVASCSQPSSANNGSFGSSVSPAPASLSQDEISTITVDAKIIKEKVAFKFDYDAIAGNATRYMVAEDPDSLIRPYINHKTEFDYYDQTEGHEQSEVDPKDPDIAAKFRFPKATPIDIFEAYLQDVEEMSYETLYHRTAVVSESLVAYQAEYDALEKEIIAHETLLKAEEKRAEERAKAAEEELREADDKKRKSVAEHFKVELEFKGQAWVDFLTKFEAKFPEATDTLRHLQNLKNPQFLANLKKKEKERSKEKEKMELENTPYPDIKMTKDEMDAEKRKRGRLMDPMKFDDMKMADAYSFDYSSHPKHTGQQPMVEVTRKRKIIGGDATEASRTRTQRKQTRKVYEAELSVSPETESDELPAKRTRKPRIFEDGSESTSRSRAASRGGTPAVKTFASGKRVGRPPTKSKLQDVQLPPLSETPEPVNGEPAPNVDGLQRHGKRTALPSGTEMLARHLAPMEEAQLHDAAESLVNRTVTDQAAAVAPVVKRKHAGGRPRKVIAQKSSNATPDDNRGSEVAAIPKPKNKGGRPKKTPILNPAITQAHSETIPHITTGKVGRRIKTEPPSRDHPVQIEDGNELLLSTELDEQSGDTSTTTSRPTSSSSDVTTSSFGSRRSNRPVTRDKTLAREGKVLWTGEMNAVGLKVQNSLDPGSGRGKRKRATADVDPTFVVVDSDPLPEVAPPIKKRKGRQSKSRFETTDTNLEAQISPPAGREKRKRIANMIESSVTVIGPYTQIETAELAKKGNVRGTEQELSVTDGDTEQKEVDVDAGIDENSLDPDAKEALRKKRVKEEKSRKLSENMKLRWANGGMKQAQATRKANNAARKAAMAATGPATLQITAPVISPQPIRPNPPLLDPQRVKKSKIIPTPIPPREPSSRARKPTRIMGGLDGPADDEDELEQQFKSEYDRFQALTRSGSPVHLGKRVRNSTLLSFSETSDEDEYDEY